MIINTNISAQSSASLLAESSSMLSKSLARLSSGSKLISPEVDAAGMAVSYKFDAQIKRIDAAKANVGNAISFSQTQDGFLKKVGKALDRMSELAILAQDVTKTDADRALYNSEFQTLADYIENVSGKDFNGVTMFSSSSMSVTMDSEDAKFTMSGINLGASSAYHSVYNGTSVAITSASGASSALTTVKAAINQLASDRSTVGATIARLTYTSEQLGVLKDNLAAANSRIKDVDVAEESTQFARYNILVQSGTAMLAQANAMPNATLRLLS